MPGSTKASSAPLVRDTPTADPKGAAPRHSLDPSPQIHLFPAQTGSISTTITQESPSPAQGYLNSPPINSLSHQPIPKLCQHSWSSNHPFNCCPDGVPVILICWQPIPFYLYSLAARTLSLEMLLLPVPGFWGWALQVTHSPLGGGVGQGEQSPWSPSQGWVCPPGESACQSPGSLCRRMETLPVLEFPPSKAFCHLPAEELQCWRISELIPQLQSSPWQGSSSTPQKLEFLCSSPRAPSLWCPHTALPVWGGRRC